MERKLYQPTEKQKKNWTALHFGILPTDDEFRSRWMKAHHGKVVGWGLGKRDWILSNLTGCQEYQLGLWQARADFLQGLPYLGAPLTDENTNCYNLGYYRGWNGSEPLAGIDRITRERLQREYGQIS